MPVLLSRPRSSEQSSSRGLKSGSLARRLYSSTPILRSADSAPTQQRGASKLFKSADEAVADIKSGSVILSSGFGLCGVADTLIKAIQRRGKESLHSLTAISNNAGVQGKSGLSLLSESGQVNRFIMSYLGANKVLEKQYLSGELAIELCPQGTLVERIRAAGAGIPAFFTPTGAREFSPYTATANELKLCAFCR